MSNATDPATPLDPLGRETRAFEKMKAQLEVDHLGKWVVFHGGQLVQTRDSFEEAAEWALDTYGEEAFLIRCVGEKIAPPPILSLPIVSYGG